MKRGPLKWHGGKSYLAPWIIDQFPPHLHYVEPYAGGLAVLMARDPLDERFAIGEKSHQRGVSEVVNDLNSELVNFWRVLQDEEAFAKFLRKSQVTPFSQELWEDLREKTTPQQGKAPDVEAAYAFFVVCRMSRAGNLNSFAPLSRNRTRRSMNEQASAWWSCVEGLPEIHERLRRVVILNEDALKVIKSQDGPNTLFYLDPPYVHATRAGTDDYSHEMDDAAHLQMLEAIKKCKGKVILSGYSNKLYNDTLQGWRRKMKRIDNKVSQKESKEKITEMLWLNY